MGIAKYEGAYYLIISPTSVNDSAVSSESPRGKQGWLKTENGHILVPVNETKGYVNFKAPIIYE